MAERLLGVYDDAGAAAGAIRTLRERGLTRLESFAPVPDPRIAQACTGDEPVRRSRWRAACSAARRAGALERESLGGVITGQRVSSRRS